MTIPAEPLRIGVLGAARIAELSLVGPARATGHRLVAVAARDRSRAEAFAAEHDVERVLDSYADVVNDPGVEVVYNPLANGLHGPWNLAALAAGKHVLTEKPSASNTEEALEVQGAAEKAGTVFMEAFHYLFHPVTRRLHELLESGELGELRHVEALVAVEAPPAQDPRWSLSLAGGALMDLGCYSVHALRMLAPWAGGEPTLVGARGGGRAGAPEVDEWLDADDGQVAPALPLAPQPARPAAPDGHVQRGAARDDIGDALDEQRQEQTAERGRGLGDERHHRAEPERREQREQHGPPLHGRAPELRPARQQDAHDRDRDAQALHRTGALPEGEPDPHRHGDPERAER
ncbi:Gfo/Idh/MocA family protein [Streptomyces apricus]|uniref:Gfo/Idh/MocA family protein n=1 Tax=Streptomyces apricus TaxID=1828112 RepID=UPI001F3DBE3D|nr:Gfo/Idh/MocA family oxidoreductase [Streptomyces apricus]